MLSGDSDNNFNLYDLIIILTHFSFNERQKGSHRIFYKKELIGIINIQKTGNSNAKPYQAKQVREFLVNNKLLDNE